MQNKGAVKFVAIALALVCLYQLSFTYIASNTRKKAVEYAKKPDGSIDRAKEAAYLDSIATEPVYNFLGIRKFTFNDVQEREINLGLDLKGGMNVILQVQVEDVLIALSDNSQDSIFRSAIKRAKEKQRNSQESFIKLFGKAFTEIAPNGQLSAIFATKNLSDKISLNSSNEDILKILEKEVKSAIDNSYNILRTRIDRFGVAQPNIQPLEIDGQILIELPGIKDPERVRKLLQGTANLEFWETYSNTEIYPFLAQANQKVREIKAVKEAEADTKQTTEEKSKTLLEQADTTQTKIAEENTIEQWKKENPLFAILNPRVSQDGRILDGAAVGFAHRKDTAEINRILSSNEIRNLFPRSIQVKFLWSVKPIDKDGNYFELIAIKISNREGLPALSGDVITNAREEFGDHKATAEVTMTMNADGAKKWARLTKNNVGKQIAIVLDDRVYSYPVVQTEITGGRSSITGNFTVAEAKDLANVLKSGKMPARAKIIQEEIVGPSLGHESINKGLWSFIIAFIIVLIYMILFYRHAGWVANVALLANLFFIMGVLSSLGAVLTLPGIAGIVLTIGMAVDANVIIYERIKEELNAGKGLKLAISDGYRNSYSAIIDSNLTTLLTAIILGYFGKGPIYGFAITLGIGIITSLFSAIFITRLLFEYLLNRDKNISFYTTATKKFMANASFKFIETRKIAYIASSILIFIGVVSLFTKGLNLGVDFTGGHSYIIRFDKPVKVQEIRNILTKEFNTAPDVKTFGENNQIKVTTKFKINDETLTADEINEYRSITGNNDPNFIIEPDDYVEAKLYNGLKDLFNNLSFSEFTSDEEKNIGRMSSMKVGPTMADDIKNSAYYAVIFSLIIIFLYILIRFTRWEFGVGALVSLTHDVLFVLGFFSIFGTILPFSMEIDQAFIAAILTVVGYSINDTVIIFDRIRELFGLYKTRELSLVINQALNSTLSRTVNTSLTTILVLVSIFLFGGEVIRGFVFAMTLGIVVGTYSSLYIATPIAYDLMKRRWGKTE
ncbi:MAG TPA: protein translocase subunit SecDF [Salinivirgaceae bacterium]|nr:protein translocase subunit SecDF [Salinivirgaceae bacterium]